MPACGAHTGGGPGRPPVAGSGKSQRFAALPLAGATSMGLAQAAGATSITRVYVVGVPPAQDDAFNEGMKAWETCLRSHGAKHTPNKNWADIGQDPSPSVKDMMNGVYGAASAQSLHQAFLATIAEHWDDAWSYDKDLSVIPGK